MSLRDCSQPGNRCTVQVESKDSNNKPFASTILWLVLCSRVHPKVFSDSVEEQVQSLRVSSIKLSHMGFRYFFSPAVFVVHISREK